MPFPILLLPVAGWLAGKILDRVLDNDDLAYNGKIEQFRVGTGGHGLVLHVHFSGSSVPSLDGGIFLVRALNGSHYIKSQHDDFSDSDGDIISGNKITVRGADGFASIYIPFCAFPDPDATVTLEFVALQSDGRTYPPQRWEGVALEAKKFARRNAIAALCDGAIGAVRQISEVHPEHVRTAKKAIVQAWELDSFGTKDLQQHLRRATSSPINSEWYYPERIAVDIRDELSGDDRLMALNMMYNVAGAKGGVSEIADNFLQEIARHLELDKEKIEEVRRPWRIDNHYVVLGISPDATIDEIRRAFHRIAKKCHPDAVRDLDLAARTAATEQFRLAKLAYDILIERMRDR